VLAMFPCRPDRHERLIALAGTTGTMTLMVCASGGTTFALGALELADPGAATAALAGMRAAMVDNLGGALLHAAAWEIRGMAPNAQAARISAQGRLPDGTAVRQEAAFFARGLRVYQASVISPKIDRDAAETFFAGLKLIS